MTQDPCPCARDQQGRCPCDPNLPIIAKAKNNLRSSISLAGNALFANSIGDNPDPLLGTVGGALSGFTMGGIPGALFGALDGFSTAGQAKEDYEKLMADQNQAYMMERKFMPEIAEEGGMMASTILQTEEGERLVTPKLHISKVNAKSKHKDMDKSEVTDVIEEGTIIFSEKKKFNPSKYKDHKLAEAISYYSDNEKYDFKALKIGDILGDDEEMSFADAIDKVKKYYPTSEEKTLIAEETNAANLASRKPIIDFLFKLQGGIEPDKGNEPVKKAEGGYPDYKKLLADINGNSYANTPPGFLGNTLTAPGEENLFPFDMQVDPNQIAIPQTDPSTARNGQLGAPPAPMPTAQTATNEPLATDSIEEMMAKVRSNLLKRRGEVDSRYATDKNTINTLIDGKNNNNLLQLGNQVLFSGAQSGYSNPALENTSLIEDQYMGIPGSIIDQQVNAIGSGANSVVQALGSAGVSPGEIASYAAKTTDNVINAQGDLRSRDMTENSNNNKSKIADYRKTIQSNNERVAEAENNLRDFNNKKISSIGSHVNAFLTNKNSINDTKYNLTTKNTNNYSKTIAKIDKSGLQADIAETTMKNNNSANTGNVIDINKLKSMTKAEKEKYLKTLSEQILQ